MSLNINQFAISTVQGQLDLTFHGSVISAQVDAAQATALVAGQAVKMAATGGGVPKVIALAANTDATFGFVCRNLKDLTFAASAPIELALFGSVMYMTAGGAITRGAAVEVVYTTSKVVTTGGVNPVVGFALDKAAADGDLIRVYIQAPFSNIQPNLTNRVQVAVVTATLAQINAGKVLIAAATGQAITVTNIVARVTGTFATGTSVIVESNNGTPVVVNTYAEASIAGTAVVLMGAANTTIGAGFGVPLGVGDALQVVNNGSAQTGGTSIQFTITYTQL